MFAEIEKGPRPRGVEGGDNEIKDPQTNGTSLQAPKEAEIARAR